MYNIVGGTCAAEIILVSNVLSDLMELFSYCISYVGLQLFLCHIKTMIMILPRISGCVSYPERHPPPQPRSKVWLIVSQENQQG